MVSKRSAGEHLRTEAALLLLCARTQIEAPVADQIRSLLSRPLDWDYFNQLLLRHRITTLCYRSLRQFAQYGVPAPVLDNLHASVQQLTWYSLGQLGELCRVMALFNTQAIRAIPFKGPLLGIMAYGDPLLHLCADLDILVPEAQFEQAKALLLSHGYTSTSTPVLRNAPESAVHQVYHHELLNRQQPQVTMELHWKVDECAFISPFDALFAQEVGATLTVGGSTMPVFTPESLLLLLCSHGSKHQWWHLMWVCDVAELLRRTARMDWQRLELLARRTGNSRVLLLGLFLAHTLLDAPVLDSYLQRARACRAIMRLAREVQDALETTELPPFISMDFLLFHMRAKEQLRHRLKLLLHFTLVPGEEDWTVAPLPRALSFLYVILRPLRLCQRYGSALSLRNKEKNKLPVPK